MAASSTSVEIKERWLGLANHWRQKANDSGGLAEAAAKPPSQPLPAVMTPEIPGEHTLSDIPTTEPPDFQDFMMAPNTPAPLLSPSPEELSNPQLQIEAGDHVSPSLSPSLDEVSNPQPQIDADVPRVIELDDDWKRILADIRGR